jgi:2-keto-4-pentenoate hydratase
MSHPDSLTPAVVAGLEQQSAGRRRLLDEGAQHLGWKAGFGTPAAMEKLGTQAPLIGYMTDRSLLAGGATVAIGDWGKPVLEPEVAVRLGSDLAPGGDRDAAVAAIDAVATAIELIDLDGPADGVETILAGNIFHRHVLLGAFTPLSADLRLDTVALDVVQGTDDVRAQGADPAGLLGDLAEVVRHLADQAPNAGDPLRAGDVIITGSAIPGVPISSGEQFEVRAGGLAPVSVRLT